MLMFDFIFGPKIQIRNKIDENMRKFINYKDKATKYTKI